MEYTRAKWTRYAGHMAKAKGEYLFDSPLQFELSRFHFTSVTPKNDTS